MSPARASILLVDDDPLVLEALSLVLEALWPVRTAPSASVAREVLLGDPSVAVVIADERMPDEAGTELFEWAVTHCPKPVRILLTGYADQETLVRAINEGRVWQYLRKPWSNDRLVAVVRRAVDYWTRVEERERADRRYRELFRQVGVGLVLATLDGQVLEANPALKASLGVPESGSLAGRSLASLGISPAGWKALVERLQRGERAEREEQVITLPTGRRVHLLVDATLRPGEGDEGPAVVASALDVTGLREAEAAHREVQELLLRMQRMEGVSTMINGALHDLNNNLVVQVSCAGHLRRHVTRSAEANECLEDLLSATERARELTQTLNRFLQGSNGELTPVDCNFLVREVLRLLRRAVPDRRLTLTKSLEDGLPAVRGDTSAIYQALLNLCLNACEAMENAGTLTVGTAALTVTEPGQGPLVGLPPGRYALLTVRDTGRGMPPEVRDRIFEPLFSVRAPGRKPGTGLGLTVVNAVVKQHGGVIRVETEPGAGTCFTLALPAMDPAELAAWKRAREAVLPRRESHAPQSRATVLLVDDDPAVRARGRAELEALGYHVLTAEDGRQAADIVRTHPDTRVVLLDVLMPEMGGEEARRVIQEVNPSMRFVLFSGEVLPRVVEPADDRVARLPKWELLSNLGAVLESVLSHAPREPARRA